MILQIGRHLNYNVPADIFSIHKKNLYMKLEIKIDCSEIM